MSDALVTTQPAQDPDHRMMVALTPQDVPAAQQEIKTWCDQKLAFLDSQILELREAIDIAKRNRWRVGTYQKHLRLAQMESIYFTKIKMAVDEGYLIVPNFDVQVMAVRVVDEGGVGYQELKDRWRRFDELLPDLKLAPAHGVYVSPTPEVTSTSILEVTKTESKWVPGRKTTGQTLAPQFPMIGIKPVVLDATAMAMSKRIFDSIGIVTGRKQDPLVIGTIFNPKDRYKQQRVSFFIAWWFDTRAL